MGRRRPAAGGGPRAGHRRPQAHDHHAAITAGASGHSWLVPSGKASTSRAGPLDSWRGVHAIYTEKDGPPSVTTYLVAKRRRARGSWRAKRKRADKRVLLAAFRSADTPQ